MQILVTGATGFIGNRLVNELLNRDYKVTVLSRKPLETYNVKWSKRVNSVQGDLKDRSAITTAVKGVDVVIHLAAQLGAWQAKEKDYYETNVEGTKILVEEAQKVGIKHFIYISTAGVYGRLKQVPADELHPCNPRYLYEKTKYLAEKYVLNKFQSGFPATILRPSHVYGPGDLNTLPLLRLLKKIHFFPLIGGGKSLFQPIYIDDLIEGIICCAENRDKVLGRVYNLAGKEAVTFKDYISIIGKIMAIDLFTVPCPYLVAKSGALVNELYARVFKRDPILTSFRVDFFGGNQYYDIKSAYNDFNYNPKTKIEYGIRMAINWYRLSNLI